MSKTIDWKDIPEGEAVALFGFKNGEEIDVTGIRIIGGTSSTTSKIAIASIGLLTTICAGVVIFKRLKK